MRTAPIITYVVLCLTLPLAHALTLSEVLFNPLGSDNGLEFIELAGSENLSGCTVADLASNDTLRLLHAGNDTTHVAMIVEEDGQYHLNETGATYYTPGKAIGNGLGNTEERILVMCNGSVLVNFSYSVSSLSGFSEGHSIIWNDDAWSIGVLGGTQGILHQRSEENTTINGTTNVEQSNDTVVATIQSCNATLMLTVNPLNGRSGDIIDVQIISDGFASVEGVADGEIFFSGDTLTQHRYVLALPDAKEVFVRAFAEQCDAKQRAIKRITIDPPEDIVVNETSVMHVAQELRVEENVSVPTVALEINSNESSVQSTSTQAQLVTAAVVYEDQPNIIPWVSVFGIVTLLVSVWLFRRIEG